MTPIRIDNENPMPAHEQIVESIVRLIEEGEMEVGEPLPSTRTMARILGLEHAVVFKAYQSLRGLGYIQSIQGSYMRVRKKAAQNNSTRELGSTIDWGVASTDRSEILYRTFMDDSAECQASSPMNGVIDFSGLNPDSRLFPSKDFMECINRVLASEEPEISDHESCFGNPSLRASIALRLRYLGISVSQDEILITNGTQQALDFVLKLLSQPNRRVVVESTTYTDVLPLLKFYQVQIVETPMRDEGMDLDYLERSMQSNRPCFVYTVPNFHRPTGVTSPLEHREKLLLLCKKYCVPIVEDGYEDEIQSGGKAVHPIKSMDDGGIVIYLGSFSMVLSPGVRIGWISADAECIRRLAAIRRFSDIVPSHLIQRVLVRFIGEGLFDRHLKRLQRIFQKRIRAAVQAMQECFPADVSWTRHTGGYTFWIHLKFDVEKVNLSEAMKKQGVLISPGSHSFCQKNQRNCFRISIARSNFSEIQEGIALLGRALKYLKETTAGLDTLGVG